MKSRLWGLLLIGTNLLMAQKFERLAMTPPMGWNSWNRFACDVNEQLIRETADAMVSSGMKDAGYRYVIIDDCWHGERDRYGFIQPDPVRFPSGMKALADYIHAKGLKFGLYSDAGWQTCGGRPGSRGYEFQDAMRYAEWGVDYLKYDWCNTAGLSAVGAYTTMRDALYKAGRPIVFSLCEWGTNQPWLWAKDIGHLWRTTGDITNCFDCVIDHGTWKSWGILQIIDFQDGLRTYAGPDHWNDPDMLEVGNGMTESEDRAHFSMWCMLAAPLIAGNDLRQMTPATRAILTNKEVIAVDQDSLGIQGFRFLRREGLEVWFKPLQQSAWAVAFLNRETTEKTIYFDWQQHYIKDDFSHFAADFKATRYKIRDLWAHKDIGFTDTPLRTKITGHDVLMLKITLVK